MKDGERSEIQLITVHNILEHSSVRYIPDEITQILNGEKYLREE